MYDYGGEIIRCIDGDTLEVSIDFGFRVKMDTIVRLHGINAPELHGENAGDGVRAKEFLATMLPPGAAVRLKTIKPREKFGRYLADVFIGGANVSEAMVKSGNAVPFMV